MANLLNNKTNNGGFTLIEALICIFLISIVFWGIFAAYQLGIKVVGLSKNKIIATTIANQWIEKIRNLPYQSVGTKNAVLPFAVGILDSTTTTISNNVKYQVEIQVKFVVDEADGIGKADSCNWDYKRAEVKVSWLGKFTGSLKLTSDIAPKNKNEEIQTCQKQPGGILSLSVFDAYGIIITSPLIEIFNPQTGSLVDWATPSNGEYDFPLAVSTYKVVVSKSGYSREETFNSGDLYQGKTIITPEKPNPIVLENQVTKNSFSIDKLSSFSVETLSPQGQEFFSDSFLNEAKISEKSNLIVENGELKLATSSQGYLSSGYLFSIAISPKDLISWGEFSWRNSEPKNSDLKYQIYYASGTEWFLIPEEDLPGNSTGFDLSPVDLSNLSISTYSQLKLKGNFSTNSTSTTPILYDWQVSWITSQPTPIGNVAFLLQGQKIIGLDENDNPIYKYSTTSISGANGKVNIVNLEWDNYAFLVNQTDLDLISTDPSPQPIGLNPNSNLPVRLFLGAQNSFLLTVQNFEKLEPIFSASARLYSTSLTYDKIQYTNEKGQTIFVPLEAGNYKLEISASGYTSTSTIILVVDDIIKTIKLEQVE